MIQIIRQMLQNLIDRIDAGNSNLSEEECLEVIELLKKYTDKDTYLSKYQAFNYLHVSRATFDNLVKDGKIPYGTKLYQGDSSLFWNKKDLIKYLKNSK